MASGKRASMREGPLAALFRKTEEDAAEAKQDAAPEPTPVEDIPPRSVPHPALEREPAPRIEPPGEEEHARIPTPQERLRHAFSADIPEVRIERAAPREEAEPPPARPAPPPAPPAPERDRFATVHSAPEYDAFARPDARPAPFGQARPAGQPVLRVIGVGGGGVNAVNRMVEAEVEGVEFIAVNTDLQSLQSSMADVTLHMGANLTRGLGSGSNPEIGRAAAMEEYDRIKALLKGSDMIFVTAGAGGGTGTGAAPIIARIGRELGALTVGIVTKPFGFEGTRRREQADVGIQALRDEVDTLIVVPNNRLLTVLDKQTSMVEAFRVADDVLRQGVQGVSDLVTLPGLINLDFADVRTIMSEAGNALLGIGMGTGERRAIDAAEQAVASPLLETSMEGAHSILLSITGGRDLSLWEVNEAAKAVAEAAHPEANIIFGAMIDEKVDDQVWVTVVATRYGAGAGAPRRVEPAGEARPERRAERERDDRRRPAAEPRTTTRRTGLGITEIDVPEFIPRA